MKIGQIAPKVKRYLKIFQLEFDFQVLFLSVSFRVPAIVLFVEAWHRQLRSLSYPPPTKMPSDQGSSRHVENSLGGGGSGKCCGDFANDQKEPTQTKRIIDQGNPSNLPYIWMMFDPPKMDGIQWPLMTPSTSKKHTEFHEWMVHSVFLTSKNQKNHLNVGTIERTNRINRLI